MYAFADVMTFLDSDDGVMIAVVQTGSSGGGGGGGGWR